MDTAITPSDLARELGVSAKQIRDVLRKEYGKLPFGVTRWRLAEVQAAFVRKAFQ